MCFVEIDFSLSSLLHRKFGGRRGTSANIEDVMIPLVVVTKSASSSTTMEAPVAFCVDWALDSDAAPNR